MGRHLILIAALLLTPILVHAETGGVEEIDLDEIVRKPAYGTYMGYAEFKMARYASARRIWEALDARNYGDATFNLGILYEDGLGVEKNPVRAIDYYRRGAELGSQKAMFRAGVLYWLGSPGIPQNRAEGRRYLEMAAAAGDTDARRYLVAGDADDPVLIAGRLNAEGRAADAFAVLSRAATAGHVRAQTQLAWSYESGRGVARDLALAAHWFALAANAGDGEAMYALAVMHATGAGQPKDANKSAEWLQRSAQAGYGPAIAELKQGAR